MPGWIVSLAEFDAGHRRQPGDPETRGASGARRESRPLDEAPPERWARRCPSSLDTVEGNGWFTVLNLYGPLDPRFDQAWRPGTFEFELR